MHENRESGSSPADTGAHGSDGRAAWTRPPPPFALLGGGSGAGLRRLLLVVDRWPGRGGSQVYLDQWFDTLPPSVEVQVAAGVPAQAGPRVARVHRVGALEGSVGDPAPLVEVLRRVRPDAVVVQNVMNPAALEALPPGACTVVVQDHRGFCPGRGKWIPGRGPCRDVFSDSLCRVCLEDDLYRRRLVSLTRARRDALHGRDVVVLSHYMKRELEAAGLDAERIRVVPPWVDLAPAPPAGPACVLFCGRLVEAKGVSDAVEAWRRSGTALPLVFAGTGPMRAELERSGFEVLGWLPRRRLPQVYARARALVFPPRWQEPFGIAGLEAWVLGVPVVAWDAGGIPEWHPGRPPRVPWGDVEGLARVLRETVAGPAGEPG